MGRSLESSVAEPAAPSAPAGWVVGWARTAAAAATSVLPSLLGSGASSSARGGGVGPAGPLAAAAAGSSPVGDGYGGRPAVEGGWEQLRLHEGVQAQLRRLSTQGVRLKARKGRGEETVTLAYGGPVERDGNCLFTSVARALRTGEDGGGVRARAVARCGKLRQAGLLPAGTERAIRNLYTPDVTRGWGVHLVQEQKLLLPTSVAERAGAMIAEMQSTGVDWHRAAEAVFKDVGRRVEDLDSWMDYMSLDGAEGAEHQLVTLQYVQEGLLAVDVGHRAAFGDDLALVMLATEFNRSVHVVQAHENEVNADGGLGLLFFLPHRPCHDLQGQEEASLFLLMKGADWCGAGVDHYENLFATPRDPRVTCAPAEELD